MAKTFGRKPSAGFRVVGVCGPGWPNAGKVVDIDGHRVPVLGNERAVLEAIEQSDAYTAAISNTEFLGAGGKRVLAWYREITEVNLVVYSGVVDVASPRLPMRPVANLPLLHADKPQYEDAGQFRKLAFDVVSAVVDYLAGAAKLRPRWLGRFGLEWLWRLAHDHRRLCARYFLEPLKLAAIITPDRLKRRTQQ